MPFRFLYSTRNISTLFIVFFIQFLSVFAQAQNNCVVPYNPAPATSWGMVQKFQSSAVIWNGGTPTAADLNGDGISEILVPASNNSGYFVYKGDGSNATTGTVDFQISIQSAYSSQPAIANIVSTSAGPEVIAVNASGYVYIFASTGGTETNYLYKSTTASQYTTTSTPYLVDIDGDGKAEIVLGSDVFGIVNGALVKRIAGPALGYIGQTLGSTGTPIDVIVADIISTNSGKELIYGSKVYGINLTAGTMTVLKDLSTVPLSGIAANDNGPTAVGDMNGDGKLDIVYNGSTFVVIWDPNGTTLANTLLFKRVPPSFNYGTRGLPLIANVYNDKITGGKAADLPEAIIINSVSGSAGILTAYNLNYNTTSGTATQFIWSLATNDMSGCTGVTAFDFDGNGLREIVYRDQSTLRIINGNLATPVDYATAAVASSTWGEYPIVADLNNDGQAEIAVTGNNTLQVFASDPTTTPWRAAPNYWNQRNYRIVNINSDLTVPATEINAASSVAYNNNEAQLQLSDAVGVGVPSGYSNVPDASITVNSIVGTCPTMTVSATISNTGSLLLPAGTYVTLYDANPTSGAANIVGTYQTTATIAAGVSMNVTMTANLVALSSNVFAVVNDKGTTARPFNLSSWTPNTGINECSYTNNISSKTFTCTDTDGDAVPDFADLDDDNDGILDAIEMTNCNSSVLITPSAATSSPFYGGANADRTIDGTGFTGTGLAALATAPATLNDAWLLKEPLTAGFIEYTLPVSSNIGGVVLWAPDAYNYGGGDGPPKDFTVEITYNNGQVFTTGVYTTAQPNGSGDNPGAQVFNFPITFANATKVKLNIINGWYDINGNSIGQVSTDGQTVNAAYNMFLGEFRVLCGSTDIDTDNDGIPNRLDLDSDGDGCTDAAEAGVSGTLISGDIKNGIYEVVKNNTTKTNAIAAAPYGSNGLADGVETAPESGLINYTSKYEPQALSKNLASCADTDGDGVFDSVDIDDDNDGVLDSEESPSCYMTTDEWNTTDKSLFVKITSDLNTLAPNSVYGKLTDGDGNGAAIQFSTATAQAQLNKAIYKIEFSSPTQLDALYIKKNSPTQIFAATAASLKLQGSTDNTSWTDLTAAIASPADASNTTVNGAKVLTNSNKFSVTTGAGKYKYYRIYGVVAANILSGIANEFFFDVNTATYQSSYYPKAECSNDTDGDGILNHQDLDCDGDGCSDAIESKSSTTATSTTVYPLFTSGDDTNSNGLLNVYESTTAGVVNYTSLYDPFATSANLAACKDTDSDGISDDIDLDDDNDGILDAVESPDCFYGINDYFLGPRPDFLISTDLSMAAGQTFPNKLVDGFYASTNYDVRFESTTSTINTLGSGKEVYRFNFQTPVKLEKIYLRYVNTNTHFSASTNLILRGSNDGTTWSNLSAATTYDQLIDANTATESTTIPGLPLVNNAHIFSVTQNALKYQYYDIFWSSGGGISNGGYANEVFFDVANEFISSAQPKIDCNNDTDGDGILNHKDLDSDSDGCPDAKEAGIKATLTSATVINLAGATIASGTATSTLSNAIIAGTGTSTFGNNGFVNALETSSESGIYSGTYNYSAARIKIINSCTDTDGDNVPDVLDLDDDNDGVLDIVECPPPGVVSLVPRFDIASGATTTKTITGFPEELWIDIWNIDNNFNLKINNTNITTVSEVNFAIGSTYTLPYTNVVQQSGLGLNSPNNVWEYGNTQSRPMIRIKISQFGEVKIFGLDGNKGSGNYQELTLLNAKYNIVPINITGNNTISLSQNNEYPPTYLNAEFNTYNSSGFCDTDGDGVENRLDLDADNDGCSDALESKTTTSTDANFKFDNTNDFGTNGFLNTLETVADNGIYNGYYPYDYAINSTVKGCLDNDGDGVPDVFDLDDDNDGILDAVESPTCFYSLSELAKPASVSSDLNPYDATGTYAVEKSIDGLIATYSAFKAGQYLANNEILKYTANGLIDIASLTLDLDFRAISTDAASTFRFQGSADNVIWDNLNTAAVSSLTYTPPATLILTNDLKVGKKYKYFRLYGVAGTSNFGGVANATFNLASSNRPSANPKLTCTNDTDVDGIPNHLDLDSDGDGCSDAIESGTTSTTTANFKFTGSATDFGANGFYNTLEKTNAESNLYKGSYTYYYAIDNTINVCLDSDGDGTKDVIDLDDDNDGVLDYVEQSCTESNMSKSDITVSSEIAWTFQNAPNGVYALIDNDLRQQMYPTATTLITNKTIFQFNFTAPKVLNLIELANIDNQIPFVAGGTYKIQGTNDEGTTWIDIVASQVVANSSPILATTNSIKFNMPANNKSFLSYRIYAISMDDVANWSTEVYFREVICEDINTDGDATPNRLDLDSDGDGCPDAVEAGATFRSTSGVAIANRLTTSIIPSAPNYGNNGFANGLETSNESGAYTGTYTYDYAKDASISGCTDTDGDGVPDVMDLDDDNDGVLDTIENNCSIAIVNKTGLIITKPSTINYNFNSNTIANLIDGVDNNVNVVYGPSGTLNGPWFNFEFPSPKVLTYLEIGHYVGQTLFSTTSTYKIQGSIDNSNWTDVSGTLTYNNNNTSTSGGLSNFNSNIANFPSNRTAYKFYRIVGINASSGGTWATEIYFKEFLCSTADLDGDGIPNRLDLDSDGDGCPDAVEAGSTYISTSGISGLARLSTSIIPAPYGNNGFANSIETTSESGVYTGSYNYNYAIDATTSACKDSDGDGVSDVFDIDDDNDGVLDTSEQINCLTSGIDLNTLTFNGSAITAKTANSFTTNGGDAWRSSYSNENLKLPISLKFKHNSTTGYEMFGLLPIANAQTPGDWVDGAYKFYGTGTSIYGYFLTTWDPNNFAILPTDVLSIDISISGMVTVAINGITRKTFQGQVSDYKLSLSSSRASSLTDIILTDATRTAKLNCTDLDSDTDGIPNRLDLDSDGDGCPDAAEAGTTIIPTSGVASTAKYTTSVIPAPYGNNGFANGLETSSESGAYSGTYNYNLATDASLNTCLDNDNDGVPDVLDLDDDNDGVLDTIENGTFGCAISPACVTNPSLLASTSATSTPPTGWTTFANGGSVDINQGNWQISYGQATPSRTLFPAATANTFFIYGMSKGGGGGLGSWAPYGEAFQQTLNCLTIGQTYYVSFRGAFTHSPGVNAAVSYETTPTAARFVLLRDGTQVSQAPDQLLESIQKTVMLSFVATATTHTIALAHTNDRATDLSLMVIEAGSGFLCTSAPPSLNENLDTDGDGIPNRLDLDSDGDGCPDAKESGVNGTLSSGSVKNGTGGAVTSTTTVANAIAAGPYGNNGLANGVETSTESGVVTYTSTYALNALVKDLVAPAITTQPLNRTVFIGTAAVLTTTVAAPPANRTLTYQWFKAGVAIAGATSATYTVTSAAISSTSADYYCTIGFVNSCLTTNTNTVNITVLTNPVGLTACQDGSAVLSVTKTGTNAVTYQWRKATTNLVNGAKIAGATTTSLTLTNLALADAGAYTLVATDANGAVITSLAGTITITNNTKYTIPDYSTCVTASNYTLTASSVATTSGAITTTWERSTDGGNTWSPVGSGDGVTYTVTTNTSGGTSTSTLRLSSVIAGLNGYKYRIATTNTSCTNYSNVSTITVNSAPTITAQPSNSVLCNVFGTSFTAAANGSNLTYHWQTRAPSGTWTTITALNANTIDAGVNYTNFTTATLNLSAAPVAENNNLYQVLITNSCGTATSTTAVLNPTVTTPIITTSNFTVCEGTPITLTTSSSTASPTYQWYLGGATIGGATGATYNPTASGIYSVIANATGYCKSGTASATVTINPAPLVAIAQGAVLTLSGNGGIDLTANAIPALSAPGSYNYTWYKSNVLISGSPTTSNYTVTTPGSYSVRATNNSTTCFATSPATTITELPSVNVNGSSAICADGSVAMSVALTSGQTIQWESTTDVGTYSYTAITGANSATYSATPTNLTSAPISITYRAVISGTGSTGTTNAIVVTANPIPTAIISNTASVTTLCAGTDAILTASSGAASATYQWYNNNTVITGATASSYTATSSGNYSFKVTDISCDCSATSISSTVTVVSPPAAPNLTATSKIICVNTTADLTVFQPLAIAGISYEWHSASNTLSSTLVSDPTKVGTAGTYYLFAKNNTAGCYSNASVAFTLSIVSVGQATLTAASTPIYTIGDIAIALNASTSTPTYSLRWYTAVTGGVALTAPVLPSTATAGITNYYVEQYDANASFCTSNPRQLAAVTVKPLAPIFANITYCENATAVALTATPATGGTLNWYGTAATGGTLTTTATIPATGTVTNTTYYVSQTVNGVEGARAALTVSINAAPSAPSVITGTFSVTSTNSYTYSVTSVASTTYQLILPSFMSGTSTTNSISALVNAAGSGNISIIAVNANGCLSPARTVNVSAALYVAAVPVTINTSYTIGDPSNPVNTASQITAATGATLNYYTSNAAGSTSTSEQSIPSTAGVYTYYVSQTINGVESALVSYTVTIKPQKPIVADITYCQNDVPVALTATGTALQWYTVSTSGTATSTAPTPSTGTATTTTYYVTQTVNGVESDRIALVVTINPTPDMPSVISGNTTTSTQSSEIYSVTNDANATGYIWVLPNGWTGTSSINSITATVGLSGGQIKVKAINGACASPFSTLMVDILNITNPPLTTNVIFITGSTPSNIASNTTALITGTVSSTLNFYTSNESGTASSTSQITPTTPGVYTYYVSQTSSIGVESILVPYTVTIKPIAPPINTNNGIVGNTITYCKGTSAFALTATASTGGTLKWYTVATGGASSNSAPTPSTSLVGTSNYYVSQVVNGVESDRVLIVVTVNDAPAAITATATQPTCTNSSGYIVITSPLGTGFTYSIDGSNYTNTTLFSALPAGIYFANAKNNVGCVSAPTQITINKAVAPPLSPLVSVVQPTCSTTTGSISITSTTLNTDTYSIDGGLNYQASKIFTGVAPGTYTVTTLNAGGCVSAGTTATVNAALAVPAKPSISSSSSSSSICEGTIVTLTSSALTGNQWYKDGVLIAGAINQTYAPNESGTYSVIATNAIGCSSIQSADEVITINPLPTAVISNGATLAFNNCTTTIITLTASNTSTSTGNTYQWYLNGNSINVGGTNSTYNANAAGEYSVVITNNGCSTTSAISKLIAAPSVNAANTAFCEGGSSLISGNITGFANPTYQWQVSTNDGLSFVNAIGAGTNSLTYTATTVGKYQLQVTDGGIVSTSCPINVTVFTNPTATITASPSSAVCVGSTISLNANVASGTASYTYQWLLAGGNDIAGAALSAYTTGVAGSYAVKVTDANGCVVNAAPSTISFNAVPTAPVVTITNPTCEVATGTISVTSPLGVGYTYSIDGTNYSNTTGLFTGVTPGLTYNVTVKSSTGCTSNATVATIAAALVVPAQPVITGPDSINPFSLNTYSVAAVAGATSYSWNIPGYWSGVSTTNTITIKVDISSGTLSVTANSANCVSVATTKNIVATLLSPDVNVTNISVPVSGKLTTNDIVPAGTTYSQPGINPTNPTGASITVNANGSYTFTATTAGKYIYYVPVCAAGQTTGCPVSPLEITVVDPLVNTDMPVVNNDFATVKSGTPNIINVLANDAAGNVDGTLNTSSLSITSAPKHGVALVNSDGTITYSPAAGFIGTDSLVYNVCDNSAPTPICQSAVLYFKVVPASSPSITTAVDDYASVLSSPNGTNVVFGNVLTNDNNSAGTSLTASVATGPTNAQGSFTMNANGSYTFTPTAGFSGPVDITYTVCTGSTPAACATATIHILVEASSVINPDEATAYINILTTGDISTNDVLISGTTYGQPVQQAGATITLNPNGTYSFTATEPGIYTYTIPVCAPGQTNNCPTQTLVVTVPVNILVNDAATAYVNIPQPGSIATNNTIPAGTSYGTPVADPTNPAAGSGAASSGAVLTMTANGTYTFTATVAGTYTYTVPVCAPGQTIDCPTETIVFIVPVNTLVNDAANALLNIPSSGSIATNDVVPAGTTYGTPVADPTNPAAGSGAASSGAVLTMTANGIYTFTATVAGTYTYTVPVCAPGQTTNCPTTTIVFTVSVNTIVNDVATAYLNIPKTGSIATNDVIPTGTTYGTPVADATNPAAGSGAASSGAVLTMTANGTYTFTATVAGTYTYTVPVCAPGQTSDCPTTTIVFTVPVNTLINDTDNAFVNIPKTGSIATNDVVPTGTTYGTPIAATTNPAAGSGGASSGAVLTMTANGTYTFTATVAGTYTYTVPVCALGQTSDCPTTTIVFTVPVNTLVNDVDTAFVNIPKRGTVATNDAVPTGTTYGTPIAGTTNPAAVGGATSSGAVLTMTANGTYTFTATVAGTYTYTLPVCAPGQTTNCPTTTIVFTVPVNTLVNDVDTAFVNIPKIGNIATNDIAPTGTTYGTPVAAITNPAAGTGAASSGAVLTMTANGNYTFTATVAGTYSYTIPVCAPGQTTNCPTTTIVFTVIGNNPQGTINLKYNTLLASDSVHVKLKAYEGVGPYTMIFKNSINSRIDTVKNIKDSSIILLPPFSNDVVFTIIKITDSNNSSRLSNFDKDTARLTILKPKILLTLKADLPSKLPDNSFKTKIVMKIKNNGGLYLQNVQVEADLSKVFPPDMQFVLDSVKVTSGNLALNPTYTGFGIPKAPSYTAKVVNGFSVKYRTLSTLSGSELFNNGVNLDINEEGSVVFYLTLKPGVNIEPLVLQFTSAGDGLLVQKDGNKSMQPTTSISHDNSNINAHPLVTTIGTPLPTYIPFFLINEIGASLEASQPDTVKNGYVFRFKSIIKNYSNSNLDSVAASFDINQFIMVPDSASIYGTPTVVGTTSFNSNFDGKNDIQFFKGVSQLKVGDSIKIAFDLFVKTDKTKAIWPTYLIAKGITTTGDLRVTDTSTNGSNPDPNGNKIPNESVRTIIGIGLAPPPVPEVISAVYEVDDKRNPKNINHLIKKIPIGTVPTWCNVDGTACSVNPPILPNIVGTYIWCVKSLDTITGLSSTPCVYDTVRIIPINKYSKYDLIKSAKTIEYDLNGKFIIGFNIKVANNTDRQIDSILVEDDLTKTFKRANGFKLSSIASSGTLVTNNAFDGISNIELLKPLSYLAAYGSDSIILKILIESESIDGDFINTANMKIWSDYGSLDLLSNDTVVNKNGLTNRVATKFKVPKIELNIPEGFSPNNDGIDDTWFIKHPFGMKLDVKVVNRWGNEVYSNPDYKNDWRGKGIKNFLGEDLPEGTYYFIVHTIDRNGSTNKFAGPLTIIR